MPVKISPRSIRSALLCCAAFFGAIAAQAQSGLVISQVYGGGGNTGAQYSNDFVEIYNPTNAAISVSGLSIQYASSTGVSYQSTPLTAVTLQPGHYFLVQEAAGTGSSAALPTPDTTGTINLSGTAGKVFLVNGISALTDSSCAALLADTKIIDFVGFGTATCYPGFGTSGYGPAPAPSNTSSDNRSNLTVNARNNSTDFVVLSPPVPHNSTFSTGSTSALQASGSANPASVAAGNQTTLTVSVTPGTTSTGVTVTADLSAIGGSATTNIPLTSTNTYSLLTTVTTTTRGAINLPVKVVDQQGGLVTFNITLTVGNPIPNVAIDVIQGVKSTTAQTVSPYAGQQVTTTGVVTSIISNGFFIQTPDGQTDSNPLTPEGIEVFTSTKPTVSIGNIVTVTGTVQTFPAVTVSHTPATEIASPSIVVTNSSNTTLPAPITLTPSMLTPGGGLYQLTPYEGMRVVIPSFTATSGTDGSLTESTERITSNGIFYGIITGTYGASSQTRPFREPGIDIRDNFPGQPANVAKFDDNPERILVDSDLSGGAAIDLSSGAILPNATGVLDFTFSSDSFYDPSRLILDAAYDRTQVTPGMTVQPVGPKAANEFTVASFNIERFFNTSNADDIYAVPPGVSCFSGDASRGTNLCASEAVDVTQAAYSTRLQKLSLAVRTVLNSPDVVTLEEVENQSVATDIANQINSDAGTPGLYTGYSTDNTTYYSEDGTGISVGFLVKNTVDNLGFSQFGTNVSFTPSTGSLTTLNDRPWLVLNAGIKRAAGTKDYPVTVIVNHLKSLINVNSTTSNSTRLKKEKQAEEIAGYINTLQASGQHVISGGDFNAFEFSDGYTDTLATYTNVGVLPSDQVVQPGVSGLVTPPLQNLALTLPATQRWSYVEDGSAQILDHMVVTQDLVATGVRFAYAHLNADFPLTDYNLATTPARVSDHDAAVGYFILPAPALTATLTPPSANFGSSIIGTPSNGQQFTLTNTGEGPLTVTSVTGSGDFAASSNCTSVAISSSCTISVVFTPTAAGTRTGTLTVVTNTSTGTYTSSLTGTGTGSTAQTITFPQPRSGVAGSTATLTATSSSGLAVVYSITSGPATVSGSTITYTGPGTVVIAANQPGNATYAAAATVSDTVTVYNNFVWLENASGTASKFSNTGTLISGPTGTADAAAGTLGGAAIDASGNIWLVEQASNALRFVSSDGSSTQTYTNAGGLNQATGIAIDGVGQIWETNGNGSVGVFTSAGVALSPSTGYTGYSIPVGIAIDLSGNVWVSNSGSNTVTEILGAAAPAAPLATAVSNGTTGARP
jgi:predicted extracellular nuclease